MTGTGVHRYPVRVQYEDTDMGGIVYHANYLRFCERARSDWVAGLGIDQWALREAGTVFAVTRIEADFRAPARFGDDLVVETALEGASPARATLRQVVTREGRTLYDSRAVLVAMTMAGRPIRLPDAIRRAG